MPSFSALQRAENSSICNVSRSRWKTSRFSALQRAENSSICNSNLAYSPPESVSVLFSEPKIPQFSTYAPDSQPYNRFSALQRAENSSISGSQAHYVATTFRFSALQRAENSSIVIQTLHILHQNPFQCSSASRKFLNSRYQNYGLRRKYVSVLFSEPKIPQFILL